MNSQVADALKELAEQFKESWPDHTGKYHFLVGAGHNIAKELATPTPIPDTGELERLVTEQVKHAYYERKTITDAVGEIVSALQDSAMVVPDGWRIDRQGDRIVVQGPDCGYATERKGLSGIAESTLYRLADAMLAASTAPGDSK